MRKADHFYPLKFFIAFMLFSYSCDEKAEPDPPALFGHNTPRPDCIYQTDTTRAAYYEEPDVVAAEWGEPVMLARPLTDDCPNDAIEISRNGKTLYFFWSPTVNGTHEQLLHIHTGTYYAERIGNDPGLFGPARFFDLQKGAENGSVDGALSFSPEGDYVYFHSTRSSNTGYQQSPPIDDPMDIYMAPVINGEPGPAVNLGEPVNSVYLDGEHGLSPDGTQLYFTSDRPGGLGGPDIWVSENTANTWSAPVNLGAPINSSDWEGQPAFAADDPETMYFVSNRDGPSSIYHSTFDDTAWSEPEMIITGYVGEPSLTADGSLLYFVHVLVDDNGVFGSNIWYVKRENGGGSR